MVSIQERKRVDLTKCRAFLGTSPPLPRSATGRNSCGGMLGMGHGRRRRLVKQRALCVCIARPRGTCGVCGCLCCPCGWLHSRQAISTTGAVVLQALCTGASCWGLQCGGLVAEDHRPGSDRGLRPEGRRQSMPFVGSWICRVFDLPNPCGEGRHQTTTSPGPGEIVGHPRHLGGSNICGRGASASTGCHV